jgi:hypothetical protein
MVYLQAPMPLKFSSSVRVRMGRTTMTFQAKRSWTAALRSIFASNFPYLSSSANEASPVHYRHSLSAHETAAGHSAVSSLPQRGRRSSSTGALPSGNVGTEPVSFVSAAHATRRRVSGGADGVSSSTGAAGLFMSHELTADDLQQIMAESNLMAAAATSNTHAAAQVDNNQRGGTNPRSSPNTSLRDEDLHLPEEEAANGAMMSQQIGDEVFVRRLLFPADGGEEDHPSVAQQDIHPAASVSSANSRRNSAQSHRLNHLAIVNASDANDHSITPPLSPMRHHPAVNHDPRKESSIIIDEDSSSCVIGTSLDLMLESSSAAPMLGSARSLSPTSRHAQSSTRALTFDRDGPVTVPPAGVFAMNYHTSSRAMSTNINTDMMNP